MPLVAAGCFLITPALSQSTWVGGTSSNWGTAANWSTASVPGAGTNAVINTNTPNPTSIPSGNWSRNGAGTTTIDGTGVVNLQTGTARFLNAGAFNMLGGQFNQTGEYFLAGNGGVGTVTHSGGAVTSNVSRGWFLSDEAAGLGTTYTLSGGSLIVNSLATYNAGNTVDRVLRSVWLGKGGEGSVSSAVTGDTFLITGGDAVFTNTHPSSTSDVLISRNSRMVIQGGSASFTGYSEIRVGFGQTLTANEKNGLTFTKSGANVNVILVSGGELEIGPSTPLILGYTDHGALNLSGGSVSLDGPLVLGGVGGGEGVVTMSGGSFRVSALDRIKGTFFFSGGVLRISGDHPEFGDGHAGRPSWFDSASAAGPVRAEYDSGTNLTTIFVEDVPEPPASLRVMSYNLRNSGASDGINSWKYRREVWLQSVRHYDPDLLGTQEVLADQHDFMESRFPDYHLLGVARNDGNRSGEWAALVVRKSRFDVLESGTFWLSLTPEVPGSISWDANQTRICSWALLKDLPTGGVVFFANAHLDHVGSVSRQRSAELMRSRLKELAEGAPMILTGDFNCTEDSEPYAELMDPLGYLTDSHREANPVRSAEELTVHDYTSNTTGSRIDWILKSRDWTARAAAIARHGPPYASDHAPVTATLVPATGSLPCREIARWNHEQFGPDSNTPEVSSPLSTPAGDGTPNLLKYAFGMTALAPASPGSMPQTAQIGSADGIHSAITFSRRNTSEPGIVYTVEESSDLEHWMSVDETDEGVSTVAESPTEGFEQVTIRLPEPISARPAAFLRVMVHTTGW